MLYKGTMDKPQSSLVQLQPRQSSHQPELSCSLLMKTMYLYHFCSQGRLRKKNKITSSGLQTIVDADPITSVPDTTLLDINRLCCHGKPLNIFHLLRISSTVTSCLIITLIQVPKLIYNIEIRKMLLYFSIKINNIAQNF